MQRVIAFVDSTIILGAMDEPSQPLSDIILSVVSPEGLWQQCEICQISGNFIKYLALMGLSTFLE